jgi:hypothetical protein
VRTGRWGQWRRSENREMWEQWRRSENRKVVEH